MKVVINCISGRYLLPEVRQFHNKAIGILIDRAIDLFWMNYQSVFI